MDKWESIIGPYGFYKEGNQIGILLIHGITGTPVEMKSLFKSLQKQGYTVACPQIKGHCQGYKALKDTRWEDWYQSIEEAFFYLAKKCQQIFIVGLSVGALLGIKLACAQKEKIGGIAILSPTIYFDGWNISGLERAYLYFILHTPLKYIWSFNEQPPYGIKDEVARGVLIRMLKLKNDQYAGQMKVPGLTMDEILKISHFIKKDIPNLSLPTLLIHSLEDDLTSVRSSEFIKTHMATTQVECIYITDCYHLITMDKQKNEVIRLTLNFINKLIKSENELKNSFISA